MIVFVCLLVKRYGDFAERVDFADWGSCIGKGLLLQPAHQACFLPVRLGGAAKAAKEKDDLANC